MGGTFRHHRYFQASKRVGSRLDYFCETEKLRETFEKFSSGITVCEGTLYCPSNEYTLHILALLVRAAIRLSEVCKYCVVCASYSTQQLTIEHFIEPNLLLVGTVATVFRECHRVLVHISKLYTSLSRWRSLLKPAESDVPGTLPDSLLCVDSIKAALEQGTIKASKEQLARQSEFFQSLLKFKPGKSLQKAANKTFEEYQDDISFAEIVTQSTFDAAKKELLERVTSTREKSDSEAESPSILTEGDFNNAKHDKETRKKTIKTSTASKKQKSENEIATVLMETKNLTSFKLFYKKLSMKHYPNERPLLLKQLKQKLKARWSALLQLKKIGDKRRLDRDLEQLRTDLLQILNKS